MPASQPPTVLLPGRATRGNRIPINPRKVVNTQPRDSTPIYHKQLHGTPHPPHPAPIPKVKWSTALTSSTLLPGHVHQQNIVVVLHCSDGSSPSGCVCRDVPPEANVTALKCHSQQAKHSYGVSPSARLFIPPLSCEIETTPPLN